MSGGIFKLTENNRELVKWYQTEENIDKQSDAWFFKQIFPPIF